MVIEFFMWIGVSLTGGYALIHAAGFHLQITSVDFIFGVEFSTKRKKSP
jgi:hypothetical protein